MSNEKILAVDDDIDIINILRIYMESEGYTFYSASSYKEATKIIDKVSIDLILLDVLLPEKDGFDICLEIRKKITTAPIIFLSCKNEEMDKVIGLSVGGDDYIVKPFLPGELLARVKSNIRRSKDYSSEVKPQIVLESGSLKVDLLTREVCFGDQEILLLPKEFDILLLFLKNPKRLFTKEEIFEYIWKSQSFENDVNTVMVHISNLRRKIGIDPSLPKIITVKGIGYKLVI
ncbi:response regulator transcription factor [Sinanaerobacter chloroacetimidivorans]|uniref:Stage 0 sporulation protein A homolog n=1 Tax=Sinanaerobacter chloroacetimidivorans TaxID=2818044 RepID=A0A8J7VZ17_9FIRM|nr:response regulator transcription factor [Sinanaerobacter chloroacetimidivorans]MBR0597306.1 response regulator transcription factor [Sinanaerobacter chloroacetimidivorans]